MNDKNRSNFTNNTDNDTTANLVAPLERYELWFHIVLWIMTAIFSVGTILGNLLVLLAYKLERNIRRQLSNKFIVSLAISDLIIGMEGFPFLTVYVVEMELWPLGTFMCEVWLCIDYTLCLVSILTVLLITVDRYCSVCYPAKYRMWQTENKINIMIVLSWVVPFAFFGLMIFGWEAMTNITVENPDSCYAPFLNDPYVNMSMYIVYYWTTLVAMSVLYRGIHKAARTLEEKSKAKEKQTMALLLGQRCMAQVGVGMFLHAQSQVESDDQKEQDSNYPNHRMKPEYTAEYTELIHDSGYITAGNTTTTTSTTRRSSEPESTKNGIDRKLILEEESLESETMEVKIIPQTQVAPIVNTQKEDIVYASKASIVEEKDLLEFDDEISELPSSKDITPTQPDQVPFFVSLSRGSSYNKKFHPNTRLSLRLKHQDSGCSLELYDGSSCTSSLFADSSVTSMLDFEAILPMLDFIEEVSLFSDNTLTRTSTSNSKRLKHDLANNNSINNNVSIMKIGSFKRATSDEFSLYSHDGDHKTLTRSTTGSGKRLTSTSMCSDNADHKTLTRSSTGSGKRLDNFQNISQVLKLGSFKRVHSPTAPAVSVIAASCDSDLEMPMSPVEQSSVEPHMCSTTLNDDESPRDGENLTKKQQQTNQQLLTVPKPGGLNRQRNFSVKAHKLLVGKDGEEWSSTYSSTYRESWQSTLSFDDQQKLTEMAESAKQDKSTIKDLMPIEEDEDSVSSKQDVVSSGEDSSTEKRSGSWVTTLFTNPSWLLHRRRKVTKAEQRAHKAFRTITVIVGTFALFWSPYYIVATIYGFCSTCVPKPLFFTSYYLCYLNSSMNPFAYAFANRLFRKTFIRLLRGDFRRT